MIIIDANVISEPLKLEPAPKVLQWLREHADELATTAITVQELHTGVAILPDGRRKRELSNAVKAAIASCRKVFPYDEPAARHAGEFIANAKANGINLTGPEDAQIAGIAKALDLAVATRNTKHFALFGIRTVCPWD